MPMRCGCNSMIDFRKNDDVTYQVVQFFEAHRHEQPNHARDSRPSWNSTELDAYIIVEVWHSVLCNISATMIMCGVCNLFFKCVVDKISW
jgi:hypothetical protein